MSSIEHNLLCVVQSTFHGRVKEFYQVLALHHFYLIAVIVPAINKIKGLDKWIQVNKTWDEFQIKL